MSNKYQVIPSNRKTYFLRNLEKILLNNNVLCKCQTKEFRKSCHEVLELVSVYLEDTKNQTNEQMSKWYEFDSLFIYFLKKDKRIPHPKKSSFVKFKKLRVY